MRRKLFFAIWLSVGLLTSMFLAACSKADELSDTPSVDTPSPSSLIKVVDEIAFSSNDEEAHSKTIKYEYDKDLKLLKNDTYTITYASDKVKMDYKYDGESWANTILLSDKGYSSAYYTDRYSQVEKLWYEYFYNELGDLTRVKVYSHTPYDPDRTYNYSWVDGNLYPETYQVEYTDTIYKGNLACIIDFPYYGEPLRILTDYGYGRKCKNLLRKDYSTSNTEYTYELDKERYVTKITKKRYGGKVTEVYNIKWKVK